MVGFSNKKIVWKLVALLTSPLLVYWYKDLLTLSDGRDCWANPFGADQPGCNTQTLKGKAYHICRYFYLYSKAIAQIFSS